MSCGGYTGGLGVRRRDPSKVRRSAFFEENEYHKLYKASIGVAGAGM